MHMLKHFIFLALTALLLQGCGATMPRYEASFDNVQALKSQAPLVKLNSPAVVADKGQDSIFARANPIHSPEGSISKHVQKALEDELRLAGLVEASAPRHLDVRLRNSKLDAPIGTGSGAISADFTLREGERSLYSTRKTVTSTWDSSFMGALAIPAAANAFNPLVRKLLAELYQDPAFIEAMKQ
jgi:hypothetical protein